MVNFPRNAKSQCGKKHAKPTGNFTVGVVSHIPIFSQRAYSCQIGSYLNEWTRGHRSPPVGASSVTLAIKCDRCGFEDVFESVTAFFGGERSERKEMFWSVWYHTQRFWNLLVFLLCPSHSSSCYLLSTRAYSYCIDIIRYLFSPCSFIFILFLLFNELVKLLSAPVHVDSSLVLSFQTAFLQY